MNRLMLAILLVSLTTFGITPSAQADTYSVHCVGWWGWYWDDPAPGQVTVRSEAPHNLCGGYSTGCPIAPVCAAFFEGSFTVTYGPDRCAPLFSAGPLLIVGTVAVAGVFTDGEGDLWTINGAFVGTSCLNDPVRGVFHASESGL